MHIVFNAGFLFYDFIASRFYMLILKYLREEILVGRKFGGFGVFF